jgi:16S rRNA processing protein RimM
MFLTGVDTRNEAEKLVGSFLFVSAGERVPLASGSYFVDQIIGLRVVSDDGTVVGVVKQVLKLPAQDVYVVEKRGEEIMIPAVREFVLRIDLQEGVMVVKLIEGLAEG